MLVLPDRLWDGPDERRAFLDGIRMLATDALNTGARSKPASFDTRELLTVGAIAAGVDVLALIVFALPQYRGAGAPYSNAAYLGFIAALLLLGFALSYVAFRTAKRWLVRLHDSSPAAAIVTSQLLIWAVPLHMLLSYFGRL
jgi:hypothetical protein